MTRPFLAACALLNEAQESLNFSHSLSSRRVDNRYIGSVRPKLLCRVAPLNLEIIERLTRAVKV